MTVPPAKQPSAKPVSSQAGRRKSNESWPNRSTILRTKLLPAFPAGYTTSDFLGVGVVINAPLAKSL
jgi:hypothetical protein